jgi:hypothetical protein
MFKCAKATFHVINDNHKPLLLILESRDFFFFFEFRDLSPLSLETKNDSLLL